MPNNSGTTKGLPSRNFRALAYDPNIPQRVYVGIRGKSGAPGGIYIADDILKVYNGGANWRKITPSKFDLYDIRDVRVDPNDPSVVYGRSATTGNRLIRGQRDAQGDYTWTETLTSFSGATDFYIWNRNGITNLVTAANISGKRAVYYLENPTTARWNVPGNWVNTGFDLPKSLELRPQVWVEPNEPLVLGGLAAQGDYIVVNNMTTKHKKGLGSFIGKFNTSGGIDWEDWTWSDGNSKSLYQSECNQAKIIEHDGKYYYYVATIGAGPFRRQLPESVAPTCNVVVSNSTIQLAGTKDSVKVSISSSEEWTSTSSEDFLSLKSYGDDYWVVVEANEEVLERTGNITLNGCVENVVIAVTQEAKPVPNQAPTVSWVSTSVTEYPAGAEVVLEVTAEDADGAIAKIAFYNGNQSLGEVTQPPYKLTINSIQAGSYEFKAVATDDDDAETTSASWDVSVMETNSYRYFKLRSFNTTSQMMINEIEWVSTENEVYPKQAITDASQVIATGNQSTAIKAFDRQKTAGWELPDAVMTEITVDLLSGNEIELKSVQVSINDVPGVNNITVYGSNNNIRWTQLFNVNNIQDNNYQGPDNTLTVLADGTMSVVNTAFTQKRKAFLASTGDRVIVKNVDMNQDFSILDINGRVMTLPKIERHQDGFIIPTNHLTPGFYILVGTRLEQPFKFVKY